MIDRKEIELLIRAQLKGGKDLDAITKSITELEAAIDKQSAAAKRGESSIDELKGSLEALRVVQRELESRASLVSSFQRTADAIGRAETRVASATQKFEEYRKKIAETGAVTDKQQASLDRYSLAIDKANVALEKQRARHEASAKSLKEAGIATEELANVSKRIGDTAIQLGTAFQKAQGAISTYTQDVREAREAERALADTQAFQRKADEAARLAKSADYVQWWTDALNKADEAERKIADDAAFRAKADDAARLAKSTEYVQWWTNALNKADEAERKLADDKVFAEKAADAAKLAKSADYVQWWADALNKADQAQERLKADNALRKTADDAQAAAQGYTSLARASDNLRPRQLSLRDAIQGIINPAQQMRSTLAGVEQEVEGLATSIGKIRGPVADYRASMDALAAAQKSLGQQAGLIDSFRRQTEQLRAARAEFTAARAQVAQYAAAVRQGGDAGAAFTNALSEAQTRARGASQALAAQLAATRQSRDALRAAGVATNDLNGATERLTRTARTASSATTQLGAAVKRYGQESERAGRISNPFTGEGGRTTLSFLQRIRGEVLALTTAYVGLFGVVRTAQGAIEAGRTRDAIRSSLSLAVGNDEARISEEYRYIEEQADRVGVSFEKAARSYSKFSVATAKAGRSNEETRFIFESMIETSRVLGLSGDQLDGLFTALTQSFSKGKIQAEELRGQIGERLPGAFAFAQEALKDAFPNLDKALEQGKVGAENLVVIMESVRRAVQDRLAKATSDAAAAQERFTNEVFRFKLAVADSGFLDAYTRALQQLVEFMRSEEGKDAALALGEAFTAAAEGVIWLLKNLDTVKTVLQGVAAYFAIALGSSVVGQIVKAAQAAQVLWGVMAKGVGYVQKFATSFPALFAAIKWGLGIVGAFFAGWEIGTWLNEKFEIVRKFGVALVTGIAELWANIKGGFEIAMAAIPVLATNAFRAVYNTIADFIRKGLSLFSLFAKAAGADELAASIDAVGNSLRVGYQDLGKATEDARRKMAQEVKNIRGIRDDMMKAVSGTQFEPSRAGGGRGFVNPPNVRPSNTTPYTGARPTVFGGSGPSEAEINKRARRIESITRSLEALDAKIDRSQTESLKSQLAAIDTQYASLAREIAALGGAEAPRFMAQLTTLTNELRKVTTDKFNDALLKERMSLLDKIEGVEVAAGKKEKLSLESRQNAIRLQYQDLYRDLAEMRLKFFNNDRDTAEIDAAKARLDAGVDELVQLEAKKFAQEELNRRQERYNQLVQARDASVGAVRAGVETGVIDQDKAAAQINTINSQMIPSINAAAEATRQWALANQAVFATPEDMQIFLANLEASRIKVTQVGQEFTRLEATVVNGSLQGINTGLNTMFDALEQVATGQMSVADGFKSILSSFGQFVAQFLRDIAIMILRIMLFNALAGMGGWAGVVGRAGQASMGVKHSGGLIGSTYNGRSRNVDPVWFTNAPRYHEGGLMGLRSDEYATILQRGEEVLASDSPRNIMNGGAAAGGQPAADGQGVKFVLVDDRQKVPEAMNSSEGDRVIVESLRRNASTLRQILG